MLKHAVIPFLVGASLLASAPFAHAASNLVFCSEGSPAGFDPGQYTTGTDFDASAETIFNRLSQFERGGTAVVPGPATKWGHLQRWPDVHLPSSRRRQIPHHAILQADP